MNLIQDARLTCYLYNITRRGVMLKDLYKHNLIDDAMHDLLFDKLSQTHRLCEECKNWYGKTEYACPNCYDWCDYCNRPFPKGEGGRKMVGDEIYQVCNLHRKFKI